ncbi:MAG: putative toxin-antitoxin system toxin component, PIN family [bacterium]
MMTRKQPSRARSKLRAVFDSNVYVAKALSKNPRSPNAELFALLQDDEYFLIWCQEIRVELTEKLLVRGLTVERVAEFIAEITSLAIWIDVPASEIRRYVKDDPDDDIIVACAVAGKATYIVSNDRHLLDLYEPFPGCLVLDSLHFLFLIRGDKVSLRTRLRNWLWRLVGTMTFSEARITSNLMRTFC